MRSGPPSARDAFRTTLDLFETGLSLMRQNLRRSHVDATDDEIDRRLREWLRLRPGAEDGDSCGHRSGPNRRFEMTALESALRAVNADLGEVGARYALIGGLAVSVRTEPRFTRDADLVVAVDDDEEAEQVVRRLRVHGYDVGAVLEQDAAARLATVRLTRAGDDMGPVVDLLFASSGIESEVVAAAEPLELLPELVMPVARTGHLIALKVLSRDDATRPQDLVDLRALLRVATPVELERAREATALIASRGYHRGRDVVAEMREILAGPADS